MKMEFEGILNGTNPKYKLVEVSKSELRDIFFEAYKNDNRT